MKKKALITGVTGQDGSYLAELLLEKGYEVHGIKRRASQFNTQRVDHLYQDPHDDERNFILHYGDLTDTSNLTRLIQQIEPDEIYNLGAQSHVAVSFEAPEYTADVDGIGAPADSGSNSILGAGEKDQVLSSVDVRVIRFGPGDSAKRNNAVLPPFALRRGQALRVLDHGQLP